MRQLIYIFFFLPFLCTAQWDAMLMASKQQASTGSLIPASADIPELDFWITAEEQTGGDGSSITTVTDQKSGITITLTSLSLNIAADSAKEFDFSLSSSARMELGNPTELNYGSLGTGWTILVVYGEISGLGAAVVKGDYSLDDESEALVYLSNLTTGASYFESYSAGFSRTLGALNTSNAMVGFTSTTNGSNNERRTYRNGVEVLSVQSTANTTWTVDRPWVIGQMKNGAGWNNIFTGSIRAIGIFGKPLSAAEQLAIYNDL